ncbi:MAG: hypothetical protein C5S48_04445 [Candidatus Methanogaster sp.]|nr:MAG: hypothetical protein C5S48_04445 [ANME-2 cluster archaeon]
MVTVIVTDFLALVFLYTQHKTKAKEINLSISVAGEGHAFILSYTLKNFKIKIFYDLVYQDLQT